MEWKNVAVLALKSLSFSLLIYLMGSMGFSFSWIFLGILVWTISETVKQDKQNLFATRKETVIDEKKAILTRIQDLPAWVFFPDVERVDWLNKMIRILWPYVGDYVKDFVKVKVEPNVKSRIAKMLKLDSFKFEKIELGDMPLKIGGIKVYPDTSSRHEIIMDLDLYYSGDCYFQVSIAKIRAGIKDIQFHGNMRVIMKPLTKKIPLIGALQIFFLNAPDIDFNLTEIANVLDFPGLSNSLRKIVIDIISNMMVLPNKLPIKLISDVSTEMLNLPEPKGVLRVKVIEAQQLMKMDSLLGKADPYAFVTIGAEEFQSNIIKNTINPIWNFTCEAAIFDIRGLSIDLSVQDKDQSNKDDEMGRTKFHIEDVIAKGKLNTWLKLDNATSGEVHLEAQWLDLTSDLLQLQNYSLTESKSDDTSSCLLIVYIDSAKHLPNLKGGVEPSAFVRCTVGNNNPKQETGPIANTNDPIWEKGFTFLICDPETEEVYFEIFDQKTNHVLGHLTYRIRKLMQEGNLKINESFQLKDSEPNSRLQLFLQLLVMTPGQGVTTHEETVDNPNLSRSSEEHAPVMATPSFQNSNLGSTPPVESSPMIKRQHLEVMTENLNGDSLLRRRQTANSPEPNTDNGKSSINITMRHSKQKQALIVVVHKVINLPCPNTADPPDPYVKLQLIPESKEGKRKTTTIKNNCNPIYDETFEFPMGWQEISKYSILFSICFKSSSGFFTKRKRIGKASANLADYELSLPVNSWLEVDNVDGDED